MSKARPRPLFSAAPVVHEEIPAEGSQHPGNLTSRVRRWLTTDPEPLFRAERLQDAYHERLEATEAQPRNG